MALGPEGPLRHSQPRPLLTHLFDALNAYNQSTRSSFTSSPLLCLRISIRYTSHLRNVIAIIIMSPPFNVTSDRYHAFRHANNDIPTSHAPQSLDQRPRPDHWDILQSDDTVMTRANDHDLSDLDSKLRCCCGRPECVYLENNNTLLGGIERDLETAARLGQVRAPILFIAPNFCKVAPASAPIRGRSSPAFLSRKHLPLRLLRTLCCRPAAEAHLSYAPIFLHTHATRWILVSLWHPTALPTTSVKEVAG